MLAVVVISNSTCIVWEDMDLPSGDSQWGLMLPLCFSHTFFSPGGKGHPYCHAPSCTSGPWSLWAPRGPSSWLTLHPLTSSARKGQMARIQPGQVLGFRGQRKGTFQGSSYFLRTSVPISSTHMMYWDILHVPNVSTFQKMTSVGGSCDTFLYKFTGIAERMGVGKEGVDSTFVSWVDVLYLYYSVFEI